ncbi:hypothetical protein AOG23_33520 [Rhizobium acidisoli]|nr:hypothetical protein AOG23_33520 [Rhizobium acidisoli]
MAVRVAIREKPIHKNFPGHQPFTSRRQPLNQVSSVCRDDGIIWKLHNLNLIEVEQGRGIFVETYGDAECLDVAAAFVFHKWGEKLSS